MAYIIAGIAGTNYESSSDDEEAGNDGATKPSSASSNSHLHVSGSLVQVQAGKYMSTISCNTSEMKQIKVLLLYTGIDLIRVCE